MKYTELYTNYKKDLGIIIIYLFVYFVLKNLLQKSLLQIHYLYVAFGY